MLANLWFLWLPPFHHNNGQGAQMGIEDAGTMAWLLKEMCVNYSGDLDLEHYGRAVEL